MKISKKGKIASIIVLLVAIAGILFFAKINQTESGISAENLRARAYAELTDSDYNTQSEFVKFGAFFTRDLDSDGYAEKLNGTCKNVNQTDTLYLDINVLSEGYLKDGKITLQANNFIWETAIVEDQIVSGDYIGETTEITLQEKVLAGSQKLFWGDISSVIEDNINQYTGTATITLTGTFVDDDGNEKEINKSVELTVDWYGETKTAVNKYYYSNGGYDLYQSQEYYIRECITDETLNLKFIAAVSEFKNELPLQKQVTELEIPELNGYSPVQVSCSTSGVTTEYDETTRIFKITKESKLDDTGLITSKLSRGNKYDIEVRYPIEAYETLGYDSVTMEIPITGYNYGYNNPNEEFENPHMSTDTGITYITFTTTAGEIFGLEANVGERLYDVDSSRYTYEVSKKVAQDIYNNNTIDEYTKYPVSWEVAIGQYSAVSKIIVEEQVENNQYISDKFLSADSNFQTMYDYITTTGVYFVNTKNMLGTDGWIKLYDAEKGTLIKEFTISEANKYNKENPYPVNVKSIKVETSTPKANTVFYINQIKELNDELVTENYTFEEFEKLQTIYTYAKGTIEAAEGVIFDNNETTATLNRLGTSNYNYPYSVFTIDIDKDKITNQQTTNINLEIETISNNKFQHKWKNGMFLVKLPQNIIKANINNVEVSDKNVKISAFETYSENGNWFIKVFTQNEEETAYVMNLDLSITPDPLKTTTTQSIELYAYNESCDNYYDKAVDNYDVDIDENVTDNIGYQKHLIQIIAPSGLLTSEYVTNYDDLGSITVAPNIAEIQKSEQSRTATINVDILNNYSGTTSDIVILGKIPYKNNKYILTEEDLKSEFTSKLVSEVKVPEDLKEFATVYYSEKETPTKDVSNEENGWRLASGITDWSKIKSYLIDLGKYQLKKDDNKVFTYDVEVPGGLGFNTAAFSCHAVYYNLETAEGKLATKTEPDKVGIQVVKEYNLQITKNKTGYNNMFVKGAVYSVTTTDVDGNIITETEITNENGILVFNGLNIEKEYILKEILSPTDYILSIEEIKFVAKLDENENLVFEILEGEFKNTPQTTIDENGNYLVVTSLEDEAKYSLTINKIDQDSKPVQNVVFLLTGNGSKRYKTDANGIAVLSNLEINRKYTLQEIEAEGYYLDTAAREFTVLRDENGILKIETQDEELKLATITETEGIAQASVTVSIVNEKIPKYNLQILKIDEETKIPLVGAEFKLVSTDLGTQKLYTTDENGYINISDLNVFTEGEYLTGEYTIQETLAPVGYSNNAEEIKFKVIKNNSQNFEIIVENKENLDTLNNAEVNGDTVKLTIEDKSMFTLTKKDSETGEVLANAEFVIIEIDENGSEIDYAKDVNGNYVGIKQDDGSYIVTTDENGIITLPLRDGLYKITEVGYPEGYQEKQIVDYFRVGEEPEENEENPDEEVTPSVVEINSIEDLVDLSIEVNNGNTFKGTTVKLMKTLDFEDSSSYEDANSTAYGDLNGNDTEEILMGELINSNGIGFTPIGSSTYFEGTFDGQNYEIRNLYQNGTSTYSGLFGRVQYGEIKNLGVTGTITGTARNVGSLAGSLYYANIENCYSSLEINMDAETTNYHYIGGLAGYLNTSSKIKNSYYNGNITLSKLGVCYVGGISAYATEFAVLDNVYNLSNINITDISDIEAGGIVGRIYSGNITKSYNKGNITVTGEEIVIGGCAGSTDSAAKLYYVYNAGDLYAKSTTESHTGGIVGKIEFTDIYSAYNYGDAKSTGTSPYCGPIYSWTIDSLSNVQNSYYLNTIALYGNADYSSSISRTDEYMKTQDFINELNGEYWVLDTSNSNNGYPILSDEVIYIENIDSIEDLVRLSNHVNSGVSYSGRTVKLTKTLDFKDDTSYENANSTSFGDLNGNNTVETIKEELTNKQGKGFTPIGNTPMTYFSGTFDGQNYEIKNIYENIVLNEVKAIYTGLFVSINNATIKNLGITGEYIAHQLVEAPDVNAWISQYYYDEVVCGGISAFSNDSNIINCYSNININAINNYRSRAVAGGMIGESTVTYIENCYNSGNLTVDDFNGKEIGGIVGSNRNLTTINGCYNKGTIIGTGKGTGNYGGIAGYSYVGTIINSYNIGGLDTQGTTGGIIGNGSNDSIQNCYNTGNITTSQSYPIGGIVGKETNTVRLTECYNTGTLTGPNYIGGIAGNISSR